MKGKIKLIAVLLTVVVLLGVSGALVFAAEQGSVTDTPVDRSLRIQSFSLSLENAVFMNFKVSSENVQNVKDIQILAWDSAPAIYKKGTESLALSSLGTESGTGYELFQYTNLAAKDMTKMVYVCAYVNVDGEEIYSSPAKFSVAMYAYLKENAATPDAELVKLLDSMLAYGAASQSYFNHRTDFLATDTVYQIDVVNGKLEDGFAKGWYRADKTFTLTANAAEEGYRFSHWENSAGESVGTTETLTLKATATEKYTAVYEAAVTYSQGLTYSDNGDGTLTVTGIGTCTDTDLRIPPEHEGKKVTRIGDNAFYNRDIITNIVIPNSVNRIGYDAFAWCDGITDVIIPNSVTEVGDSAFRGCANLESAVVSSGLTYISNAMFENCYNLADITIPDSVVKIDSYAFDACDKIIEVENGIHYVDKFVVDCDIGVVEAILRDDIRGIGAMAFSGMLNLEKITIPESVKYIGALAFWNCANLDFNVVIPEGMTHIEGYTFGGCGELKNVVIPISVISIADEAFRSCDEVVVYYAGTEVNWNEISIGANADFISAPRYYYSEVAPTTDGNYWHYVNGEPTVWENN